MHFPVINSLTDKDPLVCHFVMEQADRNRLWLAGQLAAREGHINDIIGNIRARATL